MFEDLLVICLRDAAGDADQRVAVTAKGNCLAQGVFKIGGGEKSGARQGDTLAYSSMRSIQLAVYLWFGSAMAIQKPLHIASSNATLY